MKIAQPYIYRDKLGRWILDCRVGGKRTRRFFKSKPKAESALADLTRDIRDAGREWIALDHAQRLELIEIRRKCFQAGISPWRLWEHWTHGKSAPESTVTIGQAVGSLLASKREAKRREAYTSMLDAILSAWIVGIESSPLSSVTSEDLENYLRKKRVRDSSRLTMIRVFSVLFSWAVKRRWIDRNPVASMERPTVERHTPRIFTLGECRTMLVWTRENRLDCLPWLTLAMFAGIRPHELSRLTPADVDIERGIVTVSGAASKTHTRRIVDLAPNAVEWLRLSRFRAHGHEDVHQFRRSLCRDTGIKWHQDGLRHTAASMMLARDQDAAKVALQLGNSPAILLRHYRELVRREDAVEFWGIRPS